MTRMSWEGGGAELMLKLGPQARGNGISPPSSPSCILPLTIFLVKLLISY